MENDEGDFLLPNQESSRRTDEKMKQLEQENSVLKRNMTVSYTPFLVIVLLNCCTLNQDLVVGHESTLSKLQSSCFLSAPIG